MRQLDWVEMIGQDAKRYPGQPGVREKGGTSQATAAKAASGDKSLRERCLEIFATGDFTADEIAERLGLKTTQVRPRISEMAKLNQIEDSGTTRPNADANAMHVYRLARKLDGAR